MRLGEYASLMYVQWRSTRKLFIVAVAVGISSCLGTYAFSLRSGSITRQDYDTFAGVAIGGLHAAHLLWLMFLLLASGDVDDLRLSMSRYLMRLPISAWKLVAARLSFGFVTILGLALASTLTYYALFDARMERALPFSTFLVIYPTLYAMLQAVVWSFGPAGIGPTIAAICFGSLVPNGLFFDFHFAPFDVNEYSWPGVAATITMSFMASGLVIEQHRKGRFSFLETFPWSLPRSRIFSTQPAQTFVSKKAALRWYAYRSQWRIFPPIMFTLFFALVVLHLFWLPELPDDARYEIPLNQIFALYAELLLTAFYYSLIAATALTGGIFLFQGWRPIVTNERVFLFVRPVTIKTLTEARWESGAKAIAYGVVPLILIAVVALFLDLRPGPYNPVEGRPDQGNTFTILAQNYPIYTVILMTILAFASLYAAIWAGLWFENILIIGSVFGPVALFVESLPALRNMEPVLRSNYEFRITSILVGVVLTFAAVAGLRKGLVSTKHLLFVLGLAPAVGIGFYLYLNMNPIIEQTSINRSILTTIVPLYLLAILAPLITTPLVTHWARHRR